MSAIVELHVDLNVFDSISVPPHVLERLAERCWVQADAVLVEPPARPEILSDPAEGFRGHRQHETTLQSLKRLKQGMPLAVNELWDAHNGNFVDDTASMAKLIQDAAQDRQGRVTSSPLHGYLDHRRSMHPSGLPLQSHGQRALVACLPAYFLSVSPASIPRLQPQGPTELLYVFVLCAIVPFTRAQNLRVHLSYCPPYHLLDSLQPSCVLYGCRLSFSFCFALCFPTLPVFRSGPSIHLQLWDELLFQPSLRSLQCFP